MSALTDRVFAVADEHAAKRAIWCDGENISYGDLKNNAARLSQALAANGVAPGDAIGVLAHNSISFVTLMLAAADCGAVLVPLSPSLPAGAIEKAFAAGDVRHVCVDAATLEALKREPFAATYNGFWFTIDDAALIASTYAQPLRRGTDDAPCILSTTSGSTGEPKAIILTQRSKLERACAAIALYGVTSEDRVLAATPLYHSLAERLVFTALTSGAELLLMARYTPALWLACAERESATFTIAVSTQLAQIARQLRTEGAVNRCRSLRCVVSSSAPLGADDKTIILAALPGEFHECYGASEIAIASSLNLTTRDAPLASVGRPAPGVDIAILDDAGNALSQGEIGEIAARTPMLFGGYHKRSDLTAAAMHDGYFKTGDLGRIDETGALYYVGRKKEIIISGGINVYPSDVEAALADIPGVRECAAFSWPDAQLGEIVAVAIVASSPGAVSARALRRAATERLADFQQPRRFFFIDALPRNAMGKLMRRALPDAVKSQAAEAAV